MPEPVLLIEDTPSLQMVYEAILNKSGYDVDCANTAAEGARLFNKANHKIILLDLLLPDRDGLDLMADVLRVNPKLKVIVITANGSINRAVSAMRGGAFDFLVKPFDEQRLLSSVRNAVTDLGLSEQVSAVAEPNAAGFQGFIGDSPVMRDIYKKISNIGRSMATVFISGESGTGKEICADAIHALSNRAAGPFVPLNCGAIPADLLESEVFGHLKGSFTGAISDKIGAAAAADGGTLFLDEICEMDMALQTKLLRFLQTSTIQPVGSVTPRKIDVRIICATNRNPFEEVAAGRFREDLFYRLHVVPIQLPTLKNRADDVLKIAKAALQRFSAEEGKNFTRLSGDVTRVFAVHPWPGNVRQLLNVLRNAIVLNDGEAVELNMLAPEFLAALSTNMAAAKSERLTTQNSDTDDVSRESAIETLVATRRTLAELERYLIEATIQKYSGSVPRAARHLDLSPSTIYRKRESWGSKKADQN
ncbi:MAG: sigma-54-dependent Fis family transcriptional regulator [Rhodobacteraceae bacterium]|nr:sigma-54-dependent Fis family transcriptional regulator [Paracoccaceae bacterium]